MHRVYFKLTRWWYMSSTFILFYSLVVLYFSIFHEIKTIKIKKNSHFKRGIIWQKSVELFSLWKSMKISEIVFWNMEKSIRALPTLDYDYGSYYICRNLSTHLSVTLYVLLVEKPRKRQGDYMSDCGIKNMVRLWNCWTSLMYCTNLWIHVY